MASETSTKTRTNDVRTRLALIVQGAALLIAALLVLGAILVALRDNINNDNPLVKLVLDIADTFDGPFGRKDGIFDFSGKHATTKNALVNWGIAAAVYLGLGRLLAGVIRP